MLIQNIVANTELNKDDSCILFVTEPHVAYRDIKYLDNTHGKILYSRGSAPRAALCIRSDLYPWEVPAFTDRDMCTSMVKINGINVYICSVYLDITIEEVIKPQMKALILGTPLIIGLDSNSHSPMWGCMDSNPRGKDLASYFFTNNITVCNVGSVPTFKTIRAESIIDLTVMNAHAERHLNIKNWAVDVNTETFSDHRFIKFDLGKYTPIQDKFRNIRKADWTLFKECLDQEIANLPAIHERNLDECSSWLEKVISQALNTARPLKPALKRKPNPWWTAMCMLKHQEVKCLHKDKYKSPRDYDAFI